jgi:hypothetical protein
MSQVYEYMVVDQNLMALTALEDVPPGAPIPFPAPAGIRSEVAEVSCEPALRLPEAAEPAEDGLANRAHAFFHLHCVHQRSRCSNP